MHELIEFLFILNYIDKKTLQPHWITFLLNLYNFHELTDDKMKKKLNFFKNNRLDQNEHNNHFSNIIFNQKIKSQEKEVASMAQIQKEENETLKNEILYLKSELEKSKFKVNYLNKLVEDKKLELERLKTKLTKLEELRKESISHYENIIYGFQEQTSKFQYKISNFQSQISEYIDEVKQLKNQLLQSNERLAAMESSKFLKLRKRWFYIRKILGITGE